MTLLPLLFAAAPVLAGAPVWLGDVRIGEVGLPRPGLHVGAPVRVGPDELHPTWLPGEAPRLLADGFETGLPVRDELVVLTTAELAGGSDLLPAFLDLREAEGWTVRVATEQDWDAPVAAGPDGRADRIRAWLKAEYLDDPGAFLLLVGDPDPDAGDIPMVWVRPLVELAPYYPEWLAAEMDPIPTDWLYADLSGDWDCDGDGQLGEYPDDDGEGCVDFGPELIVGRLPVYGGDASALDDLLERIIARDLEADKTYRDAVLLPGALFAVDGAPSPVGDDYTDNDDGACVLATIWRDLPEAMQDRATRLFEDDGLVNSPYPHEDSLSRDAVVSAWSEGRGLVVWCGHGSDRGVYRMIWDDDANGDGRASDREMDYPAFLESQDAADLQGAPGAFTFHVSCDNGFPEVEDNIGTALLYGGAAATATASRPAIGVTAAWGEPWEPRPDLASSSDAAWYFAMAIAEGWTAGEALAWTKAALPGDGWNEEWPGWDYNSYGWYSKTQYNLYGDPTRTLEACETAADCDDGSPCNGEESCQDGFCVHSDRVDCGALDTDCTVGRCDDVTGQCVAEPRVDGAPCDDGAWCTEADTCQDGVCGGSPRSCGEREGWDTWCDEDLDACQSAPWADEEAPTSGCATAGGRTPGGLLGLLALLGLARRRRGVLAA